jgi:hypothetical protein
MQIIGKNAVATDAVKNAEASSANEILHAPAPCERVGRCQRFFSVNE